MSSSATRFLQQENIRLTKEVESLKQQNLTLERYLNTIKEIYWAGRQISSAENPRDILTQLLHKVITVVGAGDGSISRFDEAAGELIFLLVYGELGRRLEGYRIKSDVGIAGWVVENKEPIIVNNPRQDWRFSLQVDEAFSFITRSIMSVPLMSQNNDLLGVIQLIYFTSH